MIKLGGERGRNKVLALTMTFGVLATLFFIGPIRAEIMNIFIEQTDVQIGDQLSFIVSMIVEEKDMTNVSYFIVDLAGPLSITCTFDTEGNKISSCVGVDIIKLTNDTIDFNHGYGYGYGYGYCTGYGDCEETRNLSYQIIINTTEYPAGSYKTNFIALTDKGLVKVEGDNINLVEKGTLLETCSVRAKDGNLQVDELDLNGNGKLNFNVAKSSAVLGRGTLIAQKSGNRFSYRFQIVKILKNNEQKALILVKGQYKIGRHNGFEENSVLELDKKNMLVNINGTSVHAQGMKVNFMQGCEPI